MIKISHFLMALLISFNGIGQSKSDSIILDRSNIALTELNASLILAEQNRKADSIRKADLQKQIDLLKEGDISKRLELQNQILLLEKNDSIRLAEKVKKIAALRQTSIGYPVSPFKKDTLFSIYTKIGAMKPKERAFSISNKILQLYNLDFFHADSLKLEQSEGSTELVYGDMIVMSISDLDAVWMETDRQELANSYRSLIIESIQNEKEANSLTTILYRIGGTIIIIALIWLLIFLLNKIFKRTEQWIEDNKKKYFDGLKIKTYEVLSPERELFLAKKINTVVKWLVVALLIYLALPLIFSLFPFSKGWAGKLFSWIWAPAKRMLLGFWNYLPNLFTIIVIFIITRYIVRVMKFLAEEVDSERLTLNSFHADWAKPTFNIVRFLLYAFMFIVIFPYLPGSDSPVFQGVSVFLGILFSLGSSSAISNAVAGLVITYMRPFKIGDRIKIGDVTGDVMEKTLLVTRVRTIKNEDITIPNASVLNSHTINYTTSSKEHGLIIYTTVTIGYDVPWKKMYQALELAASRTDYLLKEPKPFVLQTSLDDFYVSYQINAYTNEASKQAIIYSHLFENIQDVCNEMGIEILSPHYKALRDGNAVTIPPTYLSKEYVAPTFNITNFKQKNFSE